MVLGIDIGTSSIKAMLLDTDIGVVATAKKVYGVDIPEPDCAEQNPEIWWISLVYVLEQLKSSNEIAYRSISAIGFSGQMHGLVLVDKNGKPVRPAIIWLDQRTKKQLREIENILSEARMGEVFCNRVSCGFAFPSLLWVREMEPENFSKVSFVLCPKDYLRMKITGEVGVEAVDASSTGMFAISDHDWAWEVIDTFQLPRDIFPKVAESVEIAGYVTENCAKETGLSEGIPVIYGTGDQPAQSIGNGVVSGDKLICNIGTGGQISAFIQNPVYDKKLRTNTFCHAVPDAYTIFGATLCSGMSLNWAKNKLFYMDSYNAITQMASTVSPGADGVIYLPYLSGERTPHMNPDAKGMFFGLTLAHERQHLLRSVMEGVTYSLKDCLEILNELGIDAPIMIASGGGATSELWLQIQADIFQKQVCACTVAEQACLGSSILAAVGTGIISSIEEGCRKFVTLSDKVFEPIPRHKAIYEEGYAVFKELYSKTCSLMQ